jgi:hypothetical protein
MATKLLTSHGPNGRDYSKVQLLAIRLAAIANNGGEINQRTLSNIELSLVDYNDIHKKGDLITLNDEVLIIFSSEEISETVITLWHIAPVK